VPSPSEGAAAFLAAINEAIAEGGYELVFSSDDAGTFILSHHRDELHAVVPYGSHHAIIRSLDKLELTLAAQGAGLAVPRTALSAGRGLAELGSGRIIVKPRLTFVEGVTNRINARITQSPAEARMIAQEMLEAGAQPIAQEHVDGRLMAFVAVTDRNARIVARVQQVADLTWPPGVGVSAYAHTVPVDEWLAAGVGRLLDAIAWFGLVQLQFVVGDDDVPRLIDLNGRFYGSLALSVAAGVNLPAIWARLATGRPVGAVPEAQPGTRYQWLSRDLRARLSGCAGHARGRAVIDTALRMPGAAHSVWSVRDPWPAIGHFSSKMAEWMRSG
jgi:predicted ATP-grasp superfamily ATP-dependent carboligase